MSSASCRNQAYPAWTSRTFHPGCKINLSLRITGQRPDGYHLLDSLFLALPDPHDTITFSPSLKDGLSVICTEEGIDCENNSLTKAWKIFAEATGFAPAMTCELVKGIPWGAGLGGGTADAACLLGFLRTLAKDAGIKVADSDLMAIGAKAGADVPFFLSGSPLCRVTGIGDCLENLEPGSLGLGSSYILLVMPDIRVSTPWAYKAYDEMQKACQKEGALTGAKRADKESIPLYQTAELFTNDLEAPVFGRYPKLKAVKESLLQLGAYAASMSGSGSCVYGVFANHAQALAAAETMDCAVQLCHLGGM